MAQGKKSFILYCDLIHEIDHLTDEEKGKLFQHLLEYVNDMNPVLEDRVLLGTWKPLQNKLKRDLKKFDEIREKRREAGAKGGKQRQANASKSKQRQANQADNDNDSVNVNVNDSVSDNVFTIVNYLNSRVGSNFKPTTRKTKEHINARLKEGFTVEDFKTVIEKKAEEWENDPKFCKFLRPETLFSPKFEGYLNQQQAGQSREEELNVTLLKHLRDVQFNDNDNEPTDDNRMRRIS